MDYLPHLLELIVGAVIGWCLRPQKIERISIPVVTERVKTVEVPKVVLQDKVRVEYIDRPVIVEQPTVQLVEVERERIVEKPIVERVAVPMAMSTGAAPEFPLVDVVFMDASESKVKGRERMDARLRRATLHRGDVRYACARQAEDGAWIYKQVPH